MLGTREKDFELVVSGSWKVWGMASTEGKKKAFLEEVLNNREYMQLSSHQASALVVDHLTALMGVKGKVEGS